MILKTVSSLLCGLIVSNMIVALTRRVDDYSGTQQKNKIFFILTMKSPSKDKLARDFAENTCLAGCMGPAYTNVRNGSTNTSRKKLSK